MRRCDAKEARRGSTTVEMVVTAFLLTLLAMILGATWAGFGRPTIDGLRRAQVSHEAYLAAVSLARDLGGGSWDACTPYLDSDGNARELIGTVDDWKLAGISNANHPLELAYRGNSSPDGDVQVYYDVASDRTLQRTEIRTPGGSEMPITSILTVARYVDSMTVENYDADQQRAADHVTHWYRIRLAFSLGGLTPRTYTWITTDQL